MNSSALQKAFQYALICAITVFASTLLLYLTDLIFVFFGLLSKLILGLIFLIMLIIVMLHWKKDKEVITYGQAFKFGLMIIGFYVVIMFALDLVFMYLIAPNFNEQMLLRTLESMEKLKVPEAQLDETRIQMEKGMSTPHVIGALWLMAIRAVLDTIVLLIIAAFTRKEKEIFSPPLN